MFCNHKIWSFSSESRDRGGLTSDHVPCLLALLYWLGLLTVYIFRLNIASLSTYQLNSDKLSRTSTSGTVLSDQLKDGCLITLFSNANDIVVDRDIHLEIALSDGGEKDAIRSSFKLNLARPGRWTVGEFVSKDDHTSRFEILFCDLHNNVQHTCTSLHLLTQVSVATFQLVKTL